MNGSERHARASGTATMGVRARQTLNVVPATARSTELRELETARDTLADVMAMLVGWFPSLADAAATCTDAYLDALIGGPRDVRRWRRFIALLRDIEAACLQLGAAESTLSEVRAIVGEAVADGVFARESR